MTSTLHQLIVGAMRADPIPQERPVGLFLNEGAIANANSYTPKPRRPLLETQRRVHRVFLPKKKILHRDRPYIFWKSREHLLEFPSPPGNHGHGSHSPRSYCAAALSRSLLIGPPVRKSSRNISWNRSSASSSASICASSRFCAGVSVGSTSVCISSSVIMPPRCPRPPPFQY